MSDRQQSPHHKVLGLDVNKPVTVMIRLDQSDLPNLVPITDFLVEHLSIHGWFLVYLLLLWENLSGPVVRISSLHIDAIKNIPEVAVQFNFLHKHTSCHISGCMNY